ncbi:hypothetical protein [Pseudomonas sp. Marseille-QA0892]
MEFLFILVTSCQLFLACMTYRMGLPRFAFAIAAGVVSGYVLFYLGQTGLAFIGLFTGLGFLLWSYSILRHAAPQEH